MATIASAADAAAVTAYVAIGTNLGNRPGNLHRAVQELNQHAGRVVRTSLLYTTSPQYVTDQPQFLNAVLELSTTLSATDLLVCFKDIEVRVGRVLGTLRYGPRILDVDVLFYGKHIIATTTSVGPLIVPHALLHERDFVLRPLLDIAADFVHPTLHMTIQDLHAALPPSANPPLPVLSLGVNDLMWPLHTKTYVMGIVNTTPNSFSGDGTGVDVGAALATAMTMVDQGADILDVGGESTKPNAPAVSVDEEIARVVPVIQAIRHALPPVPISIDTTKGRVAAAAIEARANLVNDVSGATADPTMLATVAAAQVPIVLMHTRGTPATMALQKRYEDVVGDVVKELRPKLDAAMAAGIPTWNIIADPGIGFAKGLAENVKLLRHIDQLKVACAPCPLLVGASRKAFLGTLCGRPIPADRGSATAATCAAAIVGGADIVRVHDVAVCVDTCKVSDAIWRP
ncbi:dihydropteroate synthase [Aphanomyces invadans]|uniref:Dihydropteroate synthase n=1 Tax=Aphanomyces invadans TaxID=157072 RepID=A0A024TQI0_9STRA|nr:dihydropteroate synthase [Aphanomyces invadans]ETV95871.1 dihydropteroate synthase [Aphanomyces invadans]|eukprot:XP_008875622.1 dihydropteroate synthase [Aphanomyces invadans]